MPEDRLRSIHPAVVPLPDFWHEPSDESMVAGIIAQIATSESINAVERTLESALEYVRLTRLKRERERFGG